jgi:hypothetical protein
VYTVFWWGKPEEIYQLEDPGIDGRILRCIFSKWDRGAYAGLIWLRIGIGGGNFECGKEPLGSIKCGEFLD